MNNIRKGFNVKVEPKIHNRFDIWKRNVETGVEEQVAYAENIVLDQMFTRLCSFLTYFNNIHYGTGSGTLASTRTSLFTFLGYKGVTNVEKIYGIPTSSWRQSCELGLTDNNGAVLTEVGIAYGSTSTNLVTHAMLRDMNGNPVSITKTAVDILTIYATIYFTLDDSHPSIKFFYPGDNDLIAYLMGGVAPPTYFYVGECGRASNWPGRIRGGVAGVYALGYSSSGSWVANIPNKRVTLATPRLAVDKGNGHLKEIDFAHSARLSLPAPGIFSGLDIVGATVGVGDGVNNTYLLPSRNVNDSGLTIKIDGVTTTAFTKSLINKFAELEMYEYNFDTDILTCVGISYDGLLSCQKGSVSGWGLYDFVDGVWVRRNQAPVGGWPTSGGNSVFFSMDKTVFSIGINVYDFTNGEWIARPPINPISNQGVCLSRNGLVVAVVLSSGSRMYVVDWVQGQWIARPNPSFASSYGVSDVGLSYDGSVIGADIYGAFRSYTWNGASWTQRTDKGSLSSTSVEALDITGEYCAICGKDYGSSLTLCQYINDAWVDLYSIGSSSEGADRVYICDDLSTIIYGIGTSPWFRIVRYEPGIGLSYVTSDSITNDSLRGSDMNAISGNGEYCILRGQGYPLAFSFPENTTKIVFDSPPANGAAITSDYTIDGIHKTAARVIDCTFTIQFGIPS